ncbi:hypothetical protein BaRGS_00027618 [Batillaria attramentaria]|uniref:Uncharacterized protein n=1 Tax=Batillaria attramentaria TaxID=370345 RepID=A0ABD0K2J9_9CAEN
MASIEDLITTLRERSQDDQRAILQALCTFCTRVTTILQLLLALRLSMQSRSLLDWRSSSGEDKDARYSQWRAEIIGLQANHPESTILHGYATVSEGTGC